MSLPRGAIAGALVACLSCTAWGQPSATPAEAPAIEAPPVAAPEAKAEAAPARSPHRLFYQSLSVLRLNPLGLITRTQLGYMYKLFGNPAVDPAAPLGDRLKQNTYLKIALNQQLSPGFFRPGVLVEAMPLALLKLAARLESHVYWGAFNLVSDFNTPTAPHDDDALDAADSYATTGWSARFDARLQIKLGKIAVRSEARAEYYDLDLEDDAPVFYESVLDTLVANKGWSLITDTDVLYFLDDHWIIGARHTWTKAFFDDADFAAGEDPGRADTNAVMHRAGPAVIYRIDPNALGGRFNEPTVFLITQFWLQHQSRTGQSVTQAYPYTLIGFAFNGDL